MDFNQMGIGGLDKEFSDIFRRAFASRVFLPDIVEQLGINTFDGSYCTALQVGVVSCSSGCGHVQPFSLYSFEKQSKKLTWVWVWVCVCSVVCVLVQYLELHSV